MSNAAALSFDDLIPPASAGSALAPGGKAAPVSFDDLIPPPAVGATVWNAIKGAQSVSSTPVSAGPQGVAATMDQVEGNNEPSAGIGDVAHRADNLARLAANGVTLGGADRLAAMVLGSGKDVERAKSAQAASEAGPVGVLASMSGAALPTGLLAKGVGAAAGAAEGIPALGALFARPVAQAAATGAGVGAGDALGTDQNVGRGAALGAAAGFGGQAVGNAIGAAGSRLGACSATRRRFQRRKNFAPQRRTPTERPKTPASFSRRTPRRDSIKPCAPTWQTSAMIRRCNRAARRC